MQYNSHATNQDCVSEVLKLCNATTATYPLVDITRRFNDALDWYVHLAAKAGKRWPFDNINESSPPLGTQTLTSGTNYYAISSFTGTPTHILSLEVLDSSGNVQPLQGEAFHEVEAAFGETYSTSETGLPTHYTKLGNFIYLRPTPSYTKAAGLRAYILRQTLYVASTDTTKVPGVPTIHHMALCRKAALPFLIENTLPHAPSIAQLIQKDERDILEYHGYRNNDFPSRLTALSQNNK